MSANRRLYIILGCLAAVLLALYAYRPADLFFWADDFIHVPESAAHVWEQRNSLRPVGNITLHLDYLLAAKNAQWYHISSVLQHLVNTLLVFMVSRLLYKKYGGLQQTVAPALLAAVLFLLYPFHSEAVFWVIGRTGTMGCMMFLPALYCFLLRNRHWGYYILTLVFFELALLSYESTWIFPLLATGIVVQDIRLGLNTRRNATAMATGIWLLFGLHLLLRYGVTHQLFSQYDASIVLQGQFKYIVHNLAGLLLRSFAPPMYNTWYMAITVAAVFIWLVWLGKKYTRQHGVMFIRMLLFAWLISLLPYLSIGIDTHGVEGGRYLYLPASMLVMYVALVLYRLYIGTAWFKGIVIAMVVVFGFYLLQFRRYYVKASAITKSTVQTIAALSGKRHVFIQNLPQYHKGAVVFRLGLPEAVAWLAPQSNSRLVVLSIDSSDVVPAAVVSNRFGVYYRQSLAMPAFTHIMVKDSTFRRNLVPKDSAGIINPATDALLYFRQDSLFVITGKE